MKDNKSIGYRAGYMFGVTVCSCASIAIIALTVRFLMWLF